MRLDTFLQAAFISIENVLKLGRGGTIEATDWEPWSRHLHAWLRNPAVRAWWERQDSPFTDEFKAHVRELLGDGGSRAPQTRAPAGGETP